MQLNTNQEEKCISTINADMYKPIAWKCGKCRYCLLSIDQIGDFIPPERGPDGDILPIQCPSCLQIHGDWSAAISTRNYPASLPYNAKHVPTDQLSTFYKRQLEPDDNLGHLLIPTDAFYPLSHEVFPVKAEPNGFYCGKCNRGLLRIDAHGKLLRLEDNAFGDILPMLCPGCQHAHTEWSPGVIKPPRFKK